MKTAAVSLLLLLAQACHAFHVATPATSRCSSVRRMMVPIDAVQHVVQNQQQPTDLQQSALQTGIRNYMGASESSTTLNLALQERRPPTPEEIAAKKRNFNIIFWGGGFVAPFLATIFYFGFKFWEK